MLFAAGVLWPLDEPTPSQTTGPLAIVGVTVVDAPNASLIPNQTVLMDGGRISEVGNAAEIDVPATARVIEGGNRCAQLGGCVQDPLALHQEPRRLLTQVRS